MGFSVETSVPVFTVFLQGLLSFFSPCVFPIVPLYVGYLSGGAKSVDEHGNISYPRRKILINTIFFVLGISFAFFVLGLGVTALGSFFSDNRIWFARISGIVMILFGLYQLGIFGQSKALGREHRLPFRLERWSMGPVPALILGFTFSFAWTPCVGPTLGSVLLMAGSSGSAVTGFLMVGVYTVGFILPFLLVGLFTGTVLDFFKKHQNVVRYTVKIGAILLLVMGFMTLTGFMNGVTSYLSGLGSPSVTEQDSGKDAGDQEKTEEDPGKNTQDSQKEAGTQEKTETKEETDASKEQSSQAAPGFTLTDQYGTEHKLSDYRGKTVFLNFWATWCPPCRGEMPDIQKLYEKYGGNKEDLIVLGVASPNVGREGDVKQVKAFLEENNYSFPVVMDDGGALSMQYGIRAYPTTFMIDTQGNVYGYVESALTKDVMESIVQQTMTGKAPE